MILPERVFGSWNSARLPTNEDSHDPCPACGSYSADLINTPSGTGRFWGYRGLRPVLAIRQVLSAATRPTLRAITPSAALHLRKSKGQGRTWPGASATESTAEVAQKGIAPVGSLPVARAGPLAADGAGQRHRSGDDVDEQ